MAGQPSAEPKGAGHPTLVGRTSVLPIPQGSTSGLPTLPPKDPTGRPSALEEAAGRIPTTGRHVRQSMCSGPLPQRNLLGKSKSVKMFRITTTGNINNRKNEFEAQSSF